MKFRKLLLGAGVIASALAISAGFGIQSASAEGTDGTADSDTTTEAKETSIAVQDIDIGFNNQFINVKEKQKGNLAKTEKKDNKLYVGFGSYNPKTPADVKVKKWIEYDNTPVNGESGVVIDTSSLSTTKVQYVVIKGDVNTKEIVIQLAAAPSRLSASVDYTDPAAPALVLNDITKGKANAVAVTNVEFATANGSSFKKYTAAKTETTGDGVETTQTPGTDLTKYQKLGATLKVRQAASGAIGGIDATNDDKKKRNASTVSVKVNGEDVTAYAIKGNFASKELKVKVAKLASGPKISVNYIKNTVSLPKTAEYRIQHKTQIGGYSTKLVESSKKKTVIVPIADFGMNGSPFTLGVRTAAKANTKDVTKSKSASNITEVSIDRIGYVYIKYGSGDNAVNIGTSNFKTVENLEKVTADRNVTFKYSEKSGQATLTNASLSEEEAYDVYVTADSSVGYITTKDTDGNEKTAYVEPASTVTGAKKLAAGKTLTLKKLKDGDRIFIRRAGDARKRTFAWAYTAFGTVKFPTETETPAAAATTTSAEQG